MILRVPTSKFVKLFTRRNSNRKNKFLLKFFASSHLGISDWTFAVFLWYLSLNFIQLNLHAFWVESTQSLTGKKLNCHKLNEAVYYCT